MLIQYNDPRTENLISENMKPMTEKTSLRNCSRNSSSRIDDRLLI